MTLTLTLFTVTGLTLMTVIMRTITDLFRPRGCSTCPWPGIPFGQVQAASNDLLNATQFYVHALLDDLQPGQTYHYRFVYSSGRESGVTPDATFTTAPDSQTRQPFTFTDGTTYVVVGSAGRPRYDWGGPVESDRNFIVGVDTTAQARYRDYAFIALDVVPAPAGGTTTMTLRAINQHGVEFDRVVFSRKAG